jgi:hypothetical protein
MSHEPLAWPFVVAMALFLFEWAILSVWRRRYRGASRIVDADREARGLKLLREWLSPEQLNSFDQNDHFDVIGNETASRYRIHRGTELNIEELGGDGRSVCAWCVVPEGNLVAGDVMLAQKIALETNERATLSTAIAYARIKQRQMR